MTKGSWTSTPSDSAVPAVRHGRSDGQPKTPAWAAALSDLSTDTITALAREFATTKNALLVPGFGIQRQDYGEQQVRMIIALAALKGELGQPGGGLAIYVYGIHGLPSTHPRLRLLPRYLQSGGQTTSSRSSRSPS